MNPEKLLVSASFCVLASSTAFANCDLSMTGDQCKAAVEARLRAAGYDIAQDNADEAEQTRTEVIKTTDEVLERLSTGLSSALGDGDITTIEDFLPRFNLFAAGGDADDAAALVFEVTDLLGQSPDQDYKFRLTLNQPTLFEPLIETIPEADRPNARDSLGGRLNDFDDVALSFVYSPNSKRWGRGRHFVHADLFDQLFASAEADRAARLAGNGDAASLARQAWTSASDALEKQIPSGQFSGFLSAGDVLGQAAQTQLGTFCSAQLDTAATYAYLESADYELLRGQQLLCAALAASPDSDVKKRLANARSADALIAAAPDITQLVTDFVAANEARYEALYVDLNDLQSTLKRFGAFALPRLIGNQPQLVFTAENRESDDLVGPDEWSAKVTYEHGFVNVNSFRKYLAADCDSDLVNQCLSTYLNDPRRQTRLARGDRLTVSLEFARNRSYDVALESGSGMLQLPTADSWLGSFGYGRYLAFDAQGRARTRLEVTLSYENVDGDDNRRDRLLGNLTFSQQLTDEAALSFSVLYANKPEYRGAVDEEFTALLGINYKLFAPAENGL